MTPIESTRLLITTWSKNDLPAAEKLWGDPEVMRYVDLRGGLSADQVRERLREEMDRQEQFGVQYWKVILKNTAQPIGCCGLRPYQLANRVYELGFHFMKQHWGCGYAREAAKAVIDHAFEVMRVPKLFAGHNPENLASAALLGKLGFHRIEDRFYAPTGLYHPSYELECPAAPAD
jgi:[ribosomal protein S5]-alanine N-acetyltransferase